MGIESSEFRRILGHWVTGVSVVAARSREGQLCGLTANSVASLSLDPPLVLVCIDRSADSHDCIQAAGSFSINILDSDAELLARRFAGSDLARKFDGVPHHTEVSGAPVLDDALAWIDCRIWAVHPGGDHTIVIGEVLGGHAREGTPLFFYRGGYGGFTP